MVTILTNTQFEPLVTLLCERKSGALVELTLPNDAHIYAQQYALYLPDKETLQLKLREWIDEQDRGEEK